MLRYAELWHLALSSFLFHFDGTGVLDSGSQPWNRWNRWTRNQGNQGNQAWSLAFMAPIWPKKSPCPSLMTMQWPAMRQGAGIMTVIYIYIYIYIFLSITEPLLNVKGHFNQNSSVAWRPSGQIVQLIEIQIVYQHLPHFPRQVSTVNLQPCSLYCSCGYAESTRNLAFALTFCNILQCNRLQVSRHLITRFHILASAVARAGWLTADAASCVWQQNLNIPKKNSLVHSGWTYTVNIKYDISFVEYIYI